MDDLKKLSVERLRDLARKHLGKGHSRLRTRAQLLEALKHVVCDPLSRLLDAAGSIVPPGKPVRVVDFPPGRPGRVRSAGTGAVTKAGAGEIAGKAQQPPPVRGKRPVGAAAPAPGQAPAKGAAAAPRNLADSAAQGRTRRAVAPAADRAAPGSGAPGKATVPAPRPGTGNARAGSSAQPRPPRAHAAPAPRVAAGRNGAMQPVAHGGPARGPSDKTAVPLAAAPEPVPPVPVPTESPVVEGFFQAPTVPRRPRRAPAPAEPLAAEPFALPREVGTDAPLLLVRDPTTLFVFWDFRRELERGAALGLREPRLLLRIYRGEHLDRSLELPLLARSTYVTGLVSGHEYTAEVLLLGRDGWTRPVGARSGPRRLPPGRVSGRLEVRTLRLPWSEPLSSAPAPSGPVAARHEPLDSPRRVPLPTSPGARDPEGGAAPSGGPRSGRN